jgi:probable F420-dependent oxidoreductase
VLDIERGVWAHVECGAHREFPGLNEIVHPAVTDLGSCANRGLAINELRHRELIGSCLARCERLSAVKLGLFSINMDSSAQPDNLVAAAQAAEAAGFESVWAGEHVVLPDPQVPPSPMAPQDPALDSVLALTWAAAHTSRLRLGTGIVILPQRNPVLLAKEVASLDVLSRGRVVFGIGAGYLEPEFRAIGANFAERGAVTDEFLDALEHLWYDDHPEYHGSFVDFAGVDAYPRPIQRPIPLVVGGHSPHAYRRAVARAHGWYGFALTPEDAATCLAGLREAESSVERSTGLGELEITVTPRGRLTRDSAAAFAELGVDRLVVYPRGANRDGMGAAIDASVEAVAGV